MGERAIENRIKKLKALEEQKKELDVQIKELQEEIKKDMETKCSSRSGPLLHGLLITVC